MHNSAVIDTSRFFPNPALQQLHGYDVAGVNGDDEDTTSTRLVLSPSLLAGTLPDVPPLDSFEDNRRLALRLLQRCQKRVGPPSSYAHETVYSGYLGVVYLEYKLSAFLHRHRQNESDHYLFQAKDQAQKASQQLEAEASSSSLKTYRRRIFKRCTLLEGQYVGAQSLFIALIHRSGQTSRACELARTLITGLDDYCQSSSNLPPSECDLLYGRAGVLQCIFFLRRELCKPDLGSDAVMRLAGQIVQEGIDCAARIADVLQAQEVVSSSTSSSLRSSSQEQKVADASVGSLRPLPLLWEWHETLYLGAAHGVVGILHTLLSLNEMERHVLDQSYNMTELIQQTIKGLEDHCFHSNGNLDSSIKLESVGSADSTISPKYKVNRSDRLVHWCHGATGHVMLLAKAFDVYGKLEYLESAKKIANCVIWPRGLLRKGVGLCHGISGNAYAFLVLAKHDASFLIQARYFAQFALTHLDALEGVPDRPYSLFEGVGGLIALIIDLARDPAEASFPLYM